MPIFKLQDISLLVDGKTLRLRFSQRVSLEFWGLTVKFWGLNKRNNQSNQQLAYSKMILIQRDLDFDRENFDPSLIKYFGETITMITLGEMWDTFTQWKMETGQIAKTTWKIRHNRTFRNVLEPWLDHPINSLLVTKLQSLTQSQYHPKTLKGLFNALGQLGDYGIMMGRWEKNPFSQLSLIAVATRKKTQRLQRQTNLKAFSYLEMEAIIKAFFLVDTDYARLVNFLFRTGCRHGEALALKWECIFPDYLVINASYDSELKITKPTKTNTDRLFPYQREGKLSKFLDSMPRYGDLVFLREDGTRLTRLGLSKLWTAKKNTPGIVRTLARDGTINQYLKPYATRHTYINLQLDQGVDPVTIADAVGNTPKTIMQFYLSKKQENELIDI